MIATLDQAHIDMILATHHVGRLACSAGNEPYVVPMTYVYHDGFIYGHTNEGLKTKILRENPRVCFEVDDIQDTLRWRSVIARGTYEELQGADAAAALDVLISGLKDRVQNEHSFDRAGGSYDGVLQRIRMRSTKGVLFRLKVEELTGRYERTS